MTREEAIGWLQRWQSTFRGDGSPLELAILKAIEALKQPELLTYDEQCIFLAAMGRERKICETVDKRWDLSTKRSLIFTCEEIERKVMATLWRREE